MGKNDGKIKFSKPIFLKKCSKILKIFLRRPLSGPTELQRNRELEIGNPKWGQTGQKLTPTLPSEIKNFHFYKTQSLDFRKKSKIIISHRQLKFFRKFLNFLIFEKFFRKFKKNFIDPRFLGKFSQCPDFIEKFENGLIIKNNNF